MKDKKKMSKSEIIENLEHTKGLLMIISIFTMVVGIIFAIVAVDASGDLVAWQNCGHEDYDFETIYAYENDDDIIGYRCCKTIKHAYLDKSKGEWINNDTEKCFFNEKTKGE